MDNFIPSTGDKFYSNGFKKKGIVVEFIDEYNWTISWDRNPTEVVRAPFTPKDVKWLWIDGSFVSTYLK